MSGRNNKARDRQPSSGGAGDDRQTDEQLEHQQHDPALRETGRYGGPDPMGGPEEVGFDEKAGPGPAPEGSDEPLGIGTLDRDEAGAGGRDPGLVDYGKTKDK